jgi:hypothetical protein
MTLSADDTVYDLSGGGGDKIASPMQVEGKQTGGQPGVEVGGGGGATVVGADDAAHVPAATAGGPRVHESSDELSHGDEISHGLQGALNALYLVAQVCYYCATVIGCPGMQPVRSSSSHKAASKTAA